jgi:hypothetical protein
MDANQPTPVTSDTATLQSLATGGQQEAWVPRAIQAPPEGLEPDERRMWAAQERFLVAFGVLGTPTHAADAAEIGAGTPYGWDNLDQLGFKARWQEARDKHTHGLETILFNRIMNAKPGQDQTLLIFSLNAAAPSKYRLLPVSEDQAIASKQTMAELKRLKLAKAKDAVD